MDVKDILRKLISFDTVSDKENLKIMEYAKNYLESLKFSCELLGDDKKILVAKYGENPILGFMGHTDTVSPRLTFGSNPFELVEKDGNLYGLGVCDMKGGIAAFLSALSKVDLDKLKYGLMVILTYDEEIDFGGINYFLSQKIDYPKYIIIGEPTDNVVMNGSKGAIAYNFEFFGKSTHSSMPEESSNTNCVNFLHELLKLDKYFHKRWCDDYEFKHTTMNFGIIKGGERINVVSDYTMATCDFRVTKDINEYKYIKKYVDRVSKKYNMKYKIILDVLPFYNDDSELMKYYEEVTGKKIKKFFGLSEASFIEHNRVLLGPGPVTAHEDKEHISEKSLYETVEIYTKIINKLCEEKKK